MTVNLTRMRIELVKYYSAAVGVSVITSDQLAVLLQCSPAEVAYMGPVIASSLKGEWRVNALELPKAKLAVVKKARADRPTDGVIDVFEYWRERTGRGQSSKLTSDRETKIRARICEGYTVEQCKQAIDGCMSSPFHTGQNDTGTVYTDITLIFRGGAKLEEFAAMATKSGPAKARMARDCDSRIESAVYGGTFEDVRAAIGGDSDAVDRWADQIASKFRLDRHYVTTTLKG